MTDGKIVLKGTIRLLSPALIGSGDDEKSDCDIVLDAEGKPFIPATSLIGVLRHHIKPANKENELNVFWGYAEKDDGGQSCVICADLYPVNSAGITIRDGIKIDNKIGMVEMDKQKKTGKKYDYQVIEKDAKFNLNITINFSSATKDFCGQMAATIKDVLQNEKISIGAKTNSGLGRIKLEEPEKREALQEYNFNKQHKQDVFKWLTGKDGNPFAADPFPLRKNTFTIKAEFKLKNSLIIRAYAEEENAPDATSMKSGSKFVIPGTSLKGAVRSRAEKILNTIKPGMTEQIMNSLFGYVDENNAAEKAKKGRIRIDEVILPELTPELHTRIKIDRFTGGALGGALFDAMPLFDGGEQKFEVKIIIDNYKDYEAGLLLLVLKDLWTGDLAVGGEKNVGRGVFEGIAAQIAWDHQSVSLEKDNLTGLADLSFFVKSLAELKEAANVGS